MAILFPPGLRLADADGNPISGAKVRVYIANTTTLASLFSDAGLTSTITNPVTTNAAGYPQNGGNACAINVAHGAYDVAFLAADDTILAAWDDVIPYGGESGDIDRTVTGNGRFRVTGAGGDVLIQFGDPSPDNIGGTVTLEGWGGSQLDSLTLKSGLVDAGSAPGALRESGKKLPGIVHTERTAFTAAATVDIPLPEWVDGVRAFEIEIEFVQSATANLRSRFSFDGGATFKSGASDYDGQFITGLVNSLAITNQTAADHMEFATNLVGATNRPARGTFRVVTVESGDDWTTVMGRIIGYNQTPRVQYSEFFYGTATAFGRATHLRLYPASGNISGSYVIRVLYGFGE